MRRIKVLYVKWRKTLHRETLTQKLYIWSFGWGHQTCEGRCGSLRAGVQCIQIYPHPPKYTRTSIKPKRNYLKQTSKLPQVT
jgi:hypothetical protein